MPKRQYISPTPGEFPLIASTPWNAKASSTPTEEDFLNVKEAGFNAGALYADLPQMANIRLAAKNKNLKLIISNSALRGTVAQMRSFVRGATGSEHEAANCLNGAEDSIFISAWSFKDHPKVSEFDSLYTPYDNLYNWDTGRNIQINLIGEPNKDIISPYTTYQEYLERFCNRFGPMALSYNHYPFYVSEQGVANTSYSQFYTDLMIFSEKYKKTGIPFWNYVQCAHVKRASDNTTRYPEMSESKLRFQIFNSLAFCVQGLVFWTYGPRPSDTNDIFVSALINDKGSLTTAGEAVKKINKEVQCLADIFLEAVPVDYYATGQRYVDPNSSTGGMMPILNREAAYPYYVETVGGKGTVVTTFKSKDKRDPFKMRHYLMITSQDTEKLQTATVRIKSGMNYGISVKGYQILPDFDNEKGRFIKLEIRTDIDIKHRLPAGGYLLFEYEIS